MFHKARLKLTAWYLIIIMLISLMFSMVIYRMLSHELERFEKAQRFRIERQLSFPPPPLGNPELIAEAKRRIILDMAFFNLIILGIAGGLSYFLAGRTLTPIKEMMEEQNRFVSDASHELRTPLTSMKTAMEVYLRDKNAKLAEAKNVIVENIGEVDRLQILTDQLLQLTQYEKTNVQVGQQEILISQIIKGAKQKVKPMANLKKIRFKEEINDGRININKESLIELLVILLDNAIKYSPKNSQVVILAEKKDRFLNIKVVDKGIGISEKELPHIFDRFYRADNARQKMAVGGYGLGLAIAKKIVENNGGSIEVKSQINKGTIFSVKFQV